MGAIFGFFDQAPRDLPSGSLERLSELMAHRGADVAGIWQGVGCGLGLRLWHTTPESLFEKAPGPPAGQDLVIACDARIDNRDALRECLGLAAEGLSDSSIVAAAYRAWGIDCATHLVGDFAFAIYNPVRDELLCVRDHFGTKPLCYGIHEGRFVFCSEAKSLVQAGMADAALDESRIADFMLGMMDDKVATFYSELKRLPPAHAILVGRDGVRTWRYWTPQIDASAPALSDEEAALGFRQRLEEAVRCRLRSAFPVGSFLSGGLDSSSVALIAARLLAEAGMQLPVFSATFPSVPDSDESQWMDTVADEAAAKGWPLQRHVFRADETGPLEVLDEMSQFLDGPSLGANVYQIWHMLGQARSVGVRVMLTGHDGDLVVSHGFAILTELAVAERWDELERELEAFAGGLAGYGGAKAALAKTYVRPAPRLLWASGHPIRALRVLQHIHRRFYFSRLDMLENLPGVGAMVTFAFGRSRAGRADVKATGASPPFMETPTFKARASQPAPEAPASVQLDHIRGLESGFLTAAFEGIEQVSAAVGVELRHPFFDKRLVEYCLSLPSEQKCRQGWSRVVLRNAMAGVLPELVRLRRDKSNQGHNFTRSLASGHARLRATLNGSNPVMARYWDLALLAETTVAYGRAPNEKDAMLLYLATAFDAWSRKPPERTT